MNKQHKIMKSTTTVRIITTTLPTTALPTIIIRTNISHFLPVPVADFHVSTYRLCVCVWREGGMEGKHYILEREE